MDKTIVNRDTESKKNPDKESKKNLIRSHRVMGSRGVTD
jgi:hypothetical protein